MTILSHDAVRKAVARAMRASAEAGQGASTDVAIETVAALLHLSTEEVREIVSAVQSEAMC